MRKTKIMISFVLIAAAILFAGNELLLGSSCPTDPWGIVSPAPRGTEWTGTLVITAQIADVSSLPAGLPGDANPLVIAGYKDQIVKIAFFVRLENSKKGSATFSGLAKYILEDPPGVEHEYYLFYALGDYCSGRIGDALKKFLSDKVYGYLPLNATNAKGALTGLTEPDDTVVQLQVDNTGRQLLQAGTPLYYSAKIKVVTYY